jgi:twinkle protein
MAHFLSDDIDFTIYERETDAKANVKPASTYIQALKDRLRTRKQQRFVYLPWTKTQESFDFRPGEVTIWAGQNGHGKSQVTTQVALSLMGQGERVCIASFEMKPVATLQRMARMFLGMNPLSPEFMGDEGIEALDAEYSTFGGWTDTRLWLYDQTGTTEASKVIGMVRYCGKELKINHVFVDNLAKCVKGEDDYNGQKMFVDEMTAIARDHQCHVHVVHHLKKPPKETDRPDKSDVKGSGSIIDQPDNLFLVWRNKAKEDDRKEGKGMKSTEPDQLLYCKKQRNYEGSGEGEPTIALWFDRDAGQYLAAEGERPMFFPNFPHIPTASNY